MIKTAFFFRKPQSRFHSIEELFGTLIGRLSDDILPIIKKLPFRSNNILKIIANLIYAAFHQSDINHITGDIHYISLLLRKRKTILTIHDLEIINRKSSLKRFIILLLWFRIPARRVSYITVISDFTKQELLNYIRISPSKIKVIPNCIAKSIEFYPKQFDNSCPVIIQVGTKNNKNIPNLLKSIAGINCKLIILGQLDSYQNQLLKTLNIKYEIYSNLSYEQVIELYRNADILAFVSTYEGFGLPILESQSVGRPVLTSNIASMPYVAGDGACFVNPYDINSIREGILKLINNPDYRNELIKKGLINVKRFRPEIITKEYATLYRQLYQEYYLKHIR